MLKYKVFAKVKFFLFCVFIIILPTQFAYSNNGYPFGGGVQAPRNAELTVGIYDWAISVQPLGDGTNEVRWYLQKTLGAGETQTSYWFGGTAIDDSQWNERPQDCHPGQSKQPFRRQYDLQDQGHGYLSHHDRSHEPGTILPRLDF